MFMKLTISFDIFFQTWRSCSYRGPCFVDRCHQETKDDYHYKRISSRRSSLQGTSLECQHEVWLITSVIRSPIHAL
jgi:hypothetical protein